MDGRNRAGICGLVIGAAAALVGGTANAQFQSSNVSLHSQLTPSQLGGSGGNDCWGYVSPSNREYALMGVNNRLAVVEITNPASPTLIGAVTHSNSTWGDIKVYQDHCYVVNESGGGMDVVDLSNVDSGQVTLVQRVTSNGLQTSHNVAVNEDSGYLYLLGSNVNGGRLVAFNLADPANPTFAGQHSSGNGGEYLHDAQIVSYTDGPYAGREICFGASEGRGVDVIDVTNKASMFLVSRTPYPNVQYCHQLWLSEDKQYLYVNDELDELSGEPSTRTLVFDVSDLTNPQLVNTFTSGLPSIDHNLYVHNGFVFEANYTSGLRVFDASDPENPVEAGWFDTYPESNSASFDGAWSCYPFFPSGTCIVSDTNRGLFVLDVSQATTGLSFTYPSGRPELLDPAGGTSFRVEVAGRNVVPEPGTGLLHYDDGNGFVAIPMQPVSDNVYDAVFPALPCLEEIKFYVSAETTTGDLYTDPSNAPASFYTAVAASGQTVVFEDNFETNTGWTVSSQNLSEGEWERAVPVGSGGSRGDPPADFDGSGQCYVTGNGLDEDVDGGPTTLTSPVFDLTSTIDPLITYARWFSNDDQDDTLEVHISDNNGSTWTPVESIGGTAGWEEITIRVRDYVDATPTVRMRFQTADQPNNSVTEAAIDGFKISELTCDETGIVLPTTFNTVFGRYVSGSVQDLHDSDDQYVVIEQRPAFTPLLPLIRLEVDGSASGDTASELTVTIETAATSIPNQPPQRLFLFNYDASSWELVDERITSLTDTVVEVTITTNPERFLENGTGDVRMRIDWLDPGNVFSPAWNTRTDQAIWEVTP